MITCRFHFTHSLSFIFSEGCQRPSPHSPAMLAFHCKCQPPIPPPQKKKEKDRRKGSRPLAREWAIVCPFRRGWLLTRSAAQTGSGVRSLDILPGFTFPSHLYFDSTNSCTGDIEMERIQPARTGFGFPGVEIDANDCQPSALSARPSKCSFPTDGRKWSSQNKFSAAESNENGGSSQAPSVQRSASKESFLKLIESRVFRTIR